MKNIILIQTSDLVIDENDSWCILQEDVACLEAYHILPMPLWLARIERGEKVNAAVWLDVNDDPMALKESIDQLSFICVYFADFKDGRGYSTAYLLRKRLQYMGSLRAFGDVLRDQLSLMRQCGFDSFSIKEGKNPYDAAKGIKGLSVTYSGSVSQPNPLFKRVQR